MKKCFVPFCFVIALAAARTAGAQVVMPPFPVLPPPAPVFASPGPVFGPVYGPFPVFLPPYPVSGRQMPVYRPQVPPDVTPPKVEAPSEAVNLSGPRFGVTYLGEGAVHELAEHDLTVSPVVSQFGWQFEKRFYASDEGLAVLTEGIVLAGGLEQGVVLPSFSWLVGMRTPGGTEFGVGPNVTPIGVGLVLAAGATFKAAALNIPVNVAVVPSKTGVRVSFMTGFNFRH